MLRPNQMLRDEQLVMLKDAGLLENRNRVLRLTIKGGETLLAKIISMPCECEKCDDNLVFYEHVWSSTDQNQAKSEKHKTHVGGYGIALDLIEGVEVAPPQEREF